MSKDVLLMVRAIHLFSHSSKEEGWSKFRHEHRNNIRSLIFGKNLHDISAISSQKQHEIYEFKDATRSIPYHHHFTLFPPHFCARKK